MDAAPDIAIRRCGPADADLLSLIGGATFLEAFGDTIAASDIMAHTRGPHGAAYYAKLLADPDTVCWLAEYGATGSPVGYAVMTTPDLPVDVRTGDTELKRIYLLAPHHGGGIARRLTEAAIDAARAMGKTRMWLGVYAGNDRAIGFYRKMGFEMAGERWFQVGDARFYDKVMLLEL